MDRSLLGLALCGVVIVGCSRQPDAPAGPDPADIAVLKQAQLEKAEAALILADQQSCIRSTLDLFHPPPGSSAEYLSMTFSSVNLSKCPGDFSESFVKMRGSFALALEKSAEYSAHQESEGDAVGAGVLTWLFEQSTDTSTGVTPYRNWSSKNDTIKQELHESIEQLKSQILTIEAVAARYRVVWTSDDQDVGTGDAASLPEKK